MQLYCVCLSLTATEPYWTRSQLWLICNDHVRLSLARDLSGEQGVQMDSRERVYRSQPPTPYPSPPSLFSSLPPSCSPPAITSSIPISPQHVSKLSSRGKCQWLSDGWKRSGVQMGSMCARVTELAWLGRVPREVSVDIYLFIFSCESHQREIITLADLILTK